MNRALVFDIVFPVVIAYFAAIYALGFRLGWLRRSGRAPAAPYTVDFLFGFLGIAALGFIASGRHRSLGDRLASWLVWTTRTLFVLAICGVVALWLTPL